MKSKPAEENNWSEVLWEHAKAGNFLAIIPCADHDDLLKVSARFAAARGLRGCIGYGAITDGKEEFVVALAEPHAEERLRRFVGRVSRELSFPVVVAEGFEVFLHIRDAAQRITVTLPFGFRPSLEEQESVSTDLQIGIDELPPANEAEWIKRLEGAYRKIQRHESFTFTMMFV